MSITPGAPARRIDHQPEFARNAGRQQFLQACVIAGVVCTLWYVVARPLEQRLVASKAALDAVSTQLASFQESVKDEPPLVPVITALTRQTNALREWTEKSGNAGRLYEAFRSIAADHHCRIERIEPNGSRVISRPGRGTAQSQPPAEVFGYTLEVTGTYENVAKFLNACEHGLGASKVVAFRITPEINSSVAAADESKPPSDLVSATIETSHLRIPIPAPESLNTKPAGALGGTP